MGGLAALPITDCWQRLVRAAGRTVQICTAQAPDSASEAVDNAIPIHIERESAAGRAPPA
jgi:hypothetical protein